MPGRTLRTRHLRRRALAALAILLWIVGVEVLPNVHLATHEDDHTHAPDGTIVRVLFDASHRHDDGTVHAHAAADDDGHDAPVRKRRDAQLALDDAPSHHAAGGLAHRAVALHQPAPPAVAPLPVLADPWQVEQSPAERLTTRIAPRPSARGPPA